MQTRSFIGWFRKKDAKADAGLPTSVTDLLKTKPKEMKPAAPQPDIRRGDLASSSIFDAQEKSKKSASSEQDRDPSTILKTATTRIARLKAGGLYPSEPSFMRKPRIRAIRRRGRLNRTEHIAATEKHHLAKSHNFKTSLKKLGPLARQIAGKPLKHAMIQMRFSPKRAAKDILRHLEHAKNMAMYERRFDPEKTYISQAWVGRATPDYEVLRRGRGRRDRMERPYTSISVVLKETATLERLAKEKEAKKMRKTIHVPLPNRKIYGQHQYYSW